MTIVDSAPKAQPEDAQALIEEAKRHRRRRRWLTAGVVALVAAVSLGVLAAISWGGGGGRVNGAPRMASSPLVGLPANNNTYDECIGSAKVGPATSADGLPAKVSGTEDLAYVTSVERNMGSGPYLGFTHRIAGLPDRRAVRAIRVGPGGGYVWTRDPSGQVEVVHVKNYGIYVYLSTASQCPNGGWVRLADNGVQVTFLAPKP
jgi:hypothetical protein